MFVRIKDFIIYVPVDTPVTIMMTDKKPEEDDDHWDDERQQMLDDYD